MERIATLNTRLLELEPHAAKHESEIRAIFEELRTSPITLAHLQQTKIGLTVNKVRKSVSADANQAALRLIVMWKEIAAKQMAAAAASTAPASAAAAGASPAIAAQPVAAAAATGSKRKADDLSSSAPSSTSAAAASAAASSNHDTAKRARSVPPAGAASSSSRAALAAPSSSAAAAAASPSMSPSASPPRQSPSPQPPMLSLASIAAAHSASSSDPPPQPAGPQLHNPNLSFYQRPRNSNPSAAAAAAAQPEDATARKKTFQGHASSSDFLLVPHTPSNPAPPVSLCSLQDMCADHCSFFVDRIPGSFLGEVPVTLALRILAKASPEQLLKFENANPRLLGETESLWRALCKRLYPSSATSASNAKPASSTWKAWFSSLGSQKSTKLLAMQAKLKAMQAGVTREKAEAATKILSVNAAVKIENKNRPVPISAAQQGPYAKLKQETKALSKATWNTR